METFNEAYFRSLKGLTLLDFYDIYHKGMSLIEIFVYDKKGYKRLVSEGVIPKELRTFISKRAGDIDRASQIISPVRRNQTYEKIFEEYITFQKMKADILSKDSSLDQIKELPTLVCPTHRTELKKLGVKRCLNKENKRVVLPMYLCEQCDKLYTFLASYEKGKILRFNGFRYKNLYGNPFALITILQKGTKCVVYGAETPTVCKRNKCNKAKLSTYNLFKLNEKDELESLGAKKCPLCGTVYVSYPVYLKNKDMLECIFANDVAVAKIEYEKLQRKKKLIEEQRKKKEERRKAEEEKRKAEEEKSKGLEQQVSSSYNSIDEDELCDHDNVIRVVDFAIWGDDFQCRHDKHVIKDIDAKISLISKNGEVFEKTISASYCRNCDIFFIMKSSYQNLKKYGTPICRICEGKSYYEGEGGSWNNLNPESKLKQYGYSVSQSENLSTIRRRAILSLLIDKDIMTRSDIISYLDLFIRMNSSRDNREIAIAKWEEDRDYIDGYKVGFFTEYGVGALHKR